MFKRQRIEAGAHKVNNLGGHNKPTRNVATGVFLSICKIPARIASWVRRLDLGLLTNAAMLLLIIVLFLALIGRVLDIRHDDGKHSVLFSGATAEQPVEKASAVVSQPSNSSQPSPLEKKAEEKPKPVPVKKPIPVQKPTEKKIEEVKAEEKPIEEKKEEKERKTTNPRILTGDVIINGAAGDIRLGSMTEIQGNLYVQNMRYFTLPCGTRITGDLIVRNVGQLRFCGCFDIEGNIYVSANSSFGPIPSSSRLGGQVIF
jgi:hypothetical protein